MSTFERLEPEPDKAHMLPYAPAVRVPAGSEYFFLSGVSPLPLYRSPSPAPEELALPVDAVEQAKRMARTLTEQLTRLGLDWTNVVHLFEFFTDLRDNGDVQVAFAEAIGEHASWTPAGTMSRVTALETPGARVEWAVIAARPPKNGIVAQPPVERFTEIAGAITASAAADEELLWLSGSTAIDFYHHHPHIEDEEDVPYRASAQVAKILGMFDPVIDFLDVTWADTLKLSVFATDARDFSAFHAGIASHLPSLPPTMWVDIDGLSGPAARLELEMIMTRGASPTGTDEIEPVIEALLHERDSAQGTTFMPAVRVAGLPLRFLSAVGPLPAGVNAPLPDDIRAQTEMLADVLDEQLEGVGLRWTNVVRMLVHVTDIREVGAVREVLAERYGTKWTPAGVATAVDALLVRGARVQLDIIAAG